MYDFVDLIVKKDVETALVDFEQRMEHRIDSSGGVGAVNFARLGVDFGSTVEGEVIAIPFEAPPAAAALVVVVAVIDFPEVPQSQRWKAGHKIVLGCKMEGGLSMTVWYLPHMNLVLVEGTAALRIWGKQAQTTFGEVGMVGIAAMKEEQEEQVVVDQPGSQVALDIVVLGVVDTVVDIVAVVGLAAAGREVHLVE